jgi:hypothetical protein
MADLRTVLTDASRRDQVIRDAEALLDSEVDSKGGLSGLAIKGAFKVVKGARPGMMRSTSMQGSIPCAMCVGSTSKN